MDRFALVLTREAAWTIQQCIRPGMELPESIGNEAVHDYQDCAFDLRRKVNNAILRFEDEPETKVVEIDINEQQAWLLDQNVQFDGKGGIGTDMLLQIFRGLWAMEYQLPPELVPEPPRPQDDPKTALEGLRDVKHLFETNDGTDMLESR